MLEGLGEPLRELRETIADVRYRGRHEQLDGELRLLGQAIELGLRYGALDEIEAAAIIRERLEPILRHIPSVSIGTPKPRGRLASRRPLRGRVSA